ncbi:MAG TPA: hypothetical protein VIM99_06685 [Blastocatellia bacterium]
MTNSPCLSILGLLIAAILLDGEVYADSFEFLTYAPPRGWTKQQLRDGISYRRPSGTGLITLYPSQPASGGAAAEFAKMWRAQVEPAAPGPVPRPQIHGDGDYTLAVGERRINIQGANASVVLTVIVGRGRAIGVLTTGAGDEVLRELAEFFNSLTITRGAPGAPTAAPVASGSGPVSAGGIEVDFDTPPGYVARQDGRMVTLVPVTADEKTLCAYGISPARPSSGNLEADARAAILEALPGWNLKNDGYYNAMRGVAGAGWPYFWFSADVQRLVGGSYEYAVAMTMAFPAGQGRVNILWGVGNLARCRPDDLSFARLFHSLRPRGWNSDGGKALSRELHGTWRNSQHNGLGQYKFMPDGRYEYGLAVASNAGFVERRFSSVSDGRYELRGSELTLIPDRRDRGVSKYRVRIYDEFVLKRWTRAMSLLDESAKPALEAQYMRIEDSR